MNVIETRSLTKYYGTERGVKDLDLSVEEGEFFGFIGPNGAGKSTTIRMLLGLISPSSGEGRVLGRDVAKEREAILRDVGYLPTEIHLYHGMRVGEILALSAKLRGVNCDKERDDLCRRLDLDPARRVNELSFGNRKKVGIVAALQHEPKLCILDEPTSGLDPLMQREFYEILSERNAKGTTIFLSSHVLSEVARYCRRAAIIKEGSLLVCAPVEELSYTGIKRVTLRGAKAAPALSCVRDVVWEGDVLRFLYDGEPSALLQTLSSLEFKDVNISDPEFDEVLMHYYAKEATV